MSSAKAIQLQSYVQKVTNRVLNGENIEDSLLEVKANFEPEPDRFARQIAGMANAANGDACYLIVGLNENRGTVVDLEKSFDTANWWAQVKSNFEHQHAPLMADYWVPVSDNGEAKELFVLEFSPALPPYVITFNQGKVRKEVPWREGTSVLSAGRFEIVKLVAPLAGRPVFEVVGSEIYTDSGTVNLSLFISPVQRVVARSSEARIRARIGSDDFESESVHFDTCDVLVADDPMYFNVESQIKIPSHSWYDNSLCFEIDIHLPVEHSEFSLEATVSGFTFDNESWIYNAPPKALPPHWLSPTSNE